jgi:hypothetical protein
MARFVWPQDWDEFLWIPLLGQLCLSINQGSHLIWKWATLVGLVHRRILLLFQPDSFTHLAGFVSDAGQANGSFLQLGTNAAPLLSMLNEQSL